LEEKTTDQGFWQPCKYFFFNLDERGSRGRVVGEQPARDGDNNQAELSAHFQLVAKNSIEIKQYKAFASQGKRSQATTERLDGSMNCTERDQARILP
jgi:hypothetical protein